MQKKRKRKGRREGWKGRQMTRISESRWRCFPAPQHSRRVATALISNLFYYLFIYFWLRWVFVAARGLSLVVVSGGYSSFRCAGFSSRWLLLLRSTGSRCAGFSSCGSWALEHRLSSCGAWVQLLHGMWDLPGPGLEPGSPALAGGFLTTAPPGKSLCLTSLAQHFVCEIRPYCTCPQLF